MPVRRLMWLTLALGIFALGACDIAVEGTSTREVRTVPATPTVPRQTVVPIAESCAPTHADPPGPYNPDAPARSVAGRGHVLTGTVRSSRDCAPVAGARLVMTPANLNDEHEKSQEATIFTDSAGAYRFECNPPNHIHMYVRADGYAPLFTNAYHPARGQAEGVFDIVLVPLER